MQYFAGIDIGSTTIKIVLTDANDRIVGQDCRPTGCHFHKNTLTAFEALLAQHHRETSADRMVVAALRAGADDVLRLCGRSRGDREEQDNRDQQAMDG